MFKDINGNELKSGDTIKIYWDGKESFPQFQTLEERDYSNVSGVKGGIRLCMGDSLSQPDDDFVKEYHVEKV